jgi:hypothetical protein
MGILILGVYILLRVWDQVIRCEVHYISCINDTTKNFKSPIAKSVYNTENYIVSVAVHITLGDPMCGIWITWTQVGSNVLLSSCEHSSIARQNVRYFIPLATTAIRVHWDPSGPLDHFLERLRIHLPQIIPNRSGDGGFLSVYAMSLS